MEHKEMTLSSGCPAASNYKRLWETAASCLSLYILYMFAIGHIREHSKTDRYFASPDTAFLMFFICKGKHIQKNTNNSVQNIVFHQFNVR